jgi:hypothetical protein
MRKKVEKGILEEIEINFGPELSAKNKVQATGSLPVLR